MSKLKLSDILYVCSYGAVVVGLIHFAYHDSELSKNAFITAFVAKAFYALIKGTFLDISIPKLSLPVGVGTHIHEVHDEK